MRNCGFAAYPTIDTLTAYLDAELGASGPSASPEETPVARTDEDLLARIEGMSDDEVDNVFGNQLTGEHRE